MWLAAVSGALQVLTHPYNWEDLDGITAQQAADASLGMLQSFYLGDCNVIGQILAFASIEAMPAWVLPFDNTQYDQADYPALFAVVPDAWKSGATFVLPTLTNRALIGNHFGSPTTPPIQGETGGEATHTLITSEMPAHNHTPNIGTAFAAFGGGGEAYALSAGTLVRQTGFTNSQGGGNAHNNMPPYLVVVWGIVAK